jgi:hypothetical protein
MMGAAFVVLLAFLPSLGNGWVAWDDDHNFLWNHHYRHGGWSGLRWAWATHLLGVYQPVAWMVFEAEHAVGGLAPSVYHGTSLALHLANVLALYVLVTAVIARARSRDFVPRRWEVPACSALAVALFAAHPLRVEAVAWASCQPYLLCTFFLITAVLAYLRAGDPGEASPNFWLSMSLAAFTIAVLSKAAAIILPAVLMILDVYPLRRLGRLESSLGREARPIWLEKLPFLAVSVIFGAVAVRARMNLLDSPAASTVDLGWRTGVACYAAIFYVVKTLAPVGLSAIYMPPGDPAQLSLGGLSVAGITMAAVVLRRSRPALLASWAVYLVALAPGVGLVLLGQPIMADRYSYIASIAWVPLLTHGLLELGRHARDRAASALSALAIISFIVIIPMTWRQCRTWRSSEALWAQVVASGAPNSVEAHRSLGHAQLASGRVDEAISSYKKAYGLATRYVATHANDSRGEGLVGAVLNDLGIALDGRRAIPPEGEAPARTRRDRWPPP